jgi:hypothetical protein
MKPTFDPNLFRQIGLDSASLTIMGSIVHTFSEPGDYRGALHRGPEVKATFYITSDKHSAVAQATIDLAALDGSAQTSTGGKDDCCGPKGGDAAHGGHRYTVNPRGYTLFHVSGGAGGYWVSVRKIDTDPAQRGYDSRMLAEGDVFSATIIRPGTYAMTNAATHAAGEIVVSYPVKGKTAYRPPNPLRIDCGPQSFEPARIALQPGQGMLFQAKVPSHIVIKLLKPDDGPPKPPGGTDRAGWTKAELK